ncbi:replication-relaxation family protein [Thiobacillus sedimenti]|uniref:Replication-relaxation family protein n=1 Tax=Thiobacillus sedimenti TaxID=3110231 RepID=A0ABZ1CL57_9PROT|nr:replication-relaxation family protein [Thiobacillus sp. SCUT-2]WRS40012.1 replication-relaxation family protein [Thiobacillus sp. SCUT-2]
MKAKDGRALARKNESNILRALHRFGWLRSRDLAVLVWRSWRSQPPKAGPSLTPLEPTASSLRMAQRTIRRLRDKRIVLCAQAPDGGVIYGLAESGARLLQRLGVPAKSGKDMMRRYSSQHYLHRCIANELAISAIVDGFRVATEREIAQGLWLGGSSGVFGKRPDALVRDGRRAFWIEVERSRRNQADYQKLLDWLKRIWTGNGNIWQPAPLTDGVELARVVFICTPTFASRLKEDLKHLGWSDELIDHRVSFESLLYSFKAISFF